MVTVLRPLSTSELLDRTFHLYKNNFLLFAGIAALPQLFVVGLHFSDWMGWLPSLILSRGLRQFLFIGASLLAVEVSHTATVTAVSSLHLSRQTGVAASYSLAKGSIFRAIVISVVAFFLPLALGLIVGFILVGIFAAIVMGTLNTASHAEVLIRAVIVLALVFAGPALALWVCQRWALAIPATVLEGGGLRTSLRRSSSLTNDRRGRIFLIYILFAGLAWVAAVIFQTPYYMMASWHALRVTHASRLALISSTVGAFLSTSLVSPLMTIALTLVYYDERVRREGYDLQLMMDSSLQLAPQAAAAPAS